MRYGNGRHAEEVERGPRCQDDPRGARTAQDDPKTAADRATRPRYAVEWRMPRPDRRDQGHLAEVLHERVSCSALCAHRGERRARGPASAAKDAGRVLNFSADTRIGDQPDRAHE